MFALLFVFILLNTLLIITSLKNPRHLTNYENNLRVSNKSIKKLNYQYSQSKSNQLFNIQSNYIVDTAIDTAGPIFFLLLQISSLNTALFIHRSKCVRNLSPVPFISLFVNCLVWTLYGYLRKDMTVLIPNGLGLLVGFICMSIYHIHSKDKPYLPYKVGLFISLFTIMLFSYNNIAAIGMVGCLLSVVLSASPLAVFKTVIKERSTSSLPFGTSVILWINSLSWVLYGFIKAKDPMIYGPSILGTILASFQLSLFLIYGFPEKDKG